MTQTLTIIVLNWDSSGNLNHQILGGYSDLYKDKVFILAPSLPMLISHQLGAYQPTEGLNFCSTINDFYIYNKHNKTAINSALKGARIEFVKTDKGNVTLQFYPENRLFSKSESMEEGSRQLLNNYLAYISNDLPEQTRLIIKGLIGSTLKAYLDIIKWEIEKGILGPRLDNWNLDISQHMAVQTGAIAKIYGPELPGNANLSEIKEHMNSLFLEGQKEHKLLCKKMGMIS
jgi:hypothetical protein